ncbi:MAG: CHAT domain-containing protein [Acidobacteria bacterium]|nr:CHAT domain-containing protein [Acidobacteriota bacterium]
MNLNSEDEKRIKEYLLGALTREEAQPLEDRLLRDDDFVEHARLVEDELIEDYQRGALGPRERGLFESHFLSTPKRRRKLLFVRRMSELAAATPAAAPRPVFRLGPLAVPRWAAAALAACVLLVAGAAVWRAYFYRPATEEALLALRAAYRERRPLETRISGLDYAPFPETRGAAEPGDPRARDLSAALILRAAADRPTVEELHNVGRLYLTRREFDKALTAFEQALAVDDKDARLHNDMGVALFEKGKLELAEQSGRAEATLARSLEHLQRATELDDSLLEARFNRALVYTAMRLLPQAEAEWEQYLARDPNSPWAEEARRQLRLLRERGGKVSRRDADLFQEFTRAYDAGEQEQVWRVFSTSHFRTGNLIANKLIDRRLDAVVKGDAEGAGYSSGALQLLSRLSRERAGDRFTSDVADVYGALTPARASGLARARELVRAANDLYGRSRNDEAIEIYGQAQRSFKQLDDAPEALLAEYWMAHCYFQQPDSPRSLSSFSRVAAESERKGYKWLQAISLNGIANVRSRETEYSQAVEASQNAYLISTRIADENGALRSLTTLAVLYRQLGQYHQSLSLTRQALDLSERISADASQVIGLYATSALSLSALGHNAAALEYARAALSLGEAMGGNPLVMSRYYVQLGLINAKLRKYDEAISDVRRGLEIGRGLQAEKIGEEIVTYALLYLGRIYRQSGSPAEALAALDQVAQVCRQKGELWLLHEAYKERLLIYSSQGDVEREREELRLVLDSYEGERAKILEESSRNAFFDKEQDIYDIAIGFANDSAGDARQSFEYSELSRARSLLDAVKTDWRLESRAGAPDLRFSGVSRALTLDEVRAQMPEQAQILQYAVLKDKLVVWVVSGKRFESRTVDVGVEELRGKVEELLELTSRPPAGDDQRLRKVSAELFDILIQPVLASLDRQKQLCVVPDKVLNVLPFGALFSPAEQKYLVALFPLLYAPSANVFIHDTALARQKEGVAGERLLSVGNPSFDREAFPDLPDLPSASHEATEITGFYSPSYSIFVGSQADKPHVLAEAGRADVIHFATHYVRDAGSPMLSQLLLARPADAAGAAREQGGVLRAHEIYALRPARARLVVLSACQSGVEVYLNGEGAIGLARPFKAAGVPLVAASLWPVDSEATADLMIDFHRRRRLQGVASVEALREAQLQMLSHPDARYRHPYYWASFIITGGYGNY